MVANFNTGSTQSSTTQVTTPSTASGNANFNTKPKDKSDTSGITGAILSGIFGIAGGIGGSAAGGIGAVPGSLIGAGAGSVAGNLLEEIIRDYIAGRDPKISKEEFIGMLDEIGIDVVFGAAGGFPIFKFGGKVISGTAGKFLHWAARTVGYRGAGLAGDIASKIFREDTVKVLSEIIPAALKETHGMAKLLRKVGASQAYSNAIKQGAFKTLQQSYRNLWADIYFKTAGVLKARGRNIQYVFKKDSKFPIRKAGDKRIPYANWGPEELARDLIAIAKRTKSGTLQPHFVDTILPNLNNDVLVLIEGIAEPLLLKFLKEAEKAGAKKGLGHFLAGSAKGAVSHAGASLLGEAAQDTASNQGLIAPDTVNFARGGLVYAQAGLSDARLDELKGKIEGSGVFQSTQAWLEVTAEEVRRQTGKTEWNDILGFMLVYYGLAGVGLVKETASKVKLPPIPEQLKSLSQFTLDVIIYTALYTPWGRRIKALLPRRTRILLDVWFVVTVLGEGITSAILTQVSDVDPQLADQLTRRLDVLEQYRPTALLRTAITGLVKAGKAIYEGTKEVNRLLSSDLPGTHGVTGSTPLISFDGLIPQSNFTAPNPPEGSPDSFNKGGLIYSNEGLSPKEQAIARYKANLNVKPTTSSLVSTAESVYDPEGKKNLKSVLEFVPGIGDVISAYDTGVAIKEGQYGLAALLAVATVIGLVPGVGDLASKGIKSIVNKIPTEDIVGITRALKDGDIEFLKSWTDSSQAKAVGADVNDLTSLEIMNRSGVSSKGILEDLSGDASMPKRAIGTLHPAHQANVDQLNAQRFASGNMIVTRDEVIKPPKSEPGLSQNVKAKSVPIHKALGKRVEKLITKLTKHIPGDQRQGGSIIEGPRNDAKQAARVAYLEAKETFDPSRNINLLTYAYNKMKGAIAESTGGVKSVDRKIGDALEIDSPIIIDGDNAGSLHDIVTSPDINADRFYEEIYGADEHIARVVADQGATKGGKAYRDATGKVVKPKSLSDTEAAQELGMTVEAYKKKKKEIIEIAKGKKAPEGDYYIYRPAGKFIKQPEFSGPASEGKLIADDPRIGTTKPLTKTEKEYLNRNKLISK